MTLIYTAIASLDGYVNDASGSFAWAAPDREVHAFVNDLERPVDTYLYGRRMWETMVFWATADDPDPIMQDYAAMWRAASKVVYSTKLGSVSGARLSRTFDADEVRSLKASADVSVGGPGIAGEALRTGLVDEVRLFLVPVVVGGGTAALSGRLDLSLLETRRFESGVVYLRYRVS